MISYKQRHANWQKNTFKKFLLPVFVFWVLVLLLPVLVGRLGIASAATSSTLAFQGRLLTSTGALVSDGSYNIEFKIYDSETLGASAAGVCSLDSSTDDCWWIESRTVSVQNGYFSVYLADVANGGTAFTSGMPWDQELWLTMNVNSDGEMSPRLKLTAVPYAFAAGSIIDSAGNAKTADDFAQIAPTTTQAVNAALAALRLNQTGTGGLLQLQGDGSDVFTVDKTGAAILGAGITVGNSSSTTAGTIRWSGTDLEVYDGSTWTSLTSGGGGGGGGGSSNTTSVIKPADETITNDATLHDDADLTFSIGANESWIYRFTLQAQSGTTPDFRFGVNAPVGATCYVAVIDPEGAISNSNFACGSAITGIPGNAVNDVYEIVGTVQNGATAGNVTVQWGQNTASGQQTIVRAGSTLFAVQEGAAGASTTFDQGGNAFGGTAILGTTDAYGLNVITNGSTALQITSAGDATFANDLTLSTGNLNLTAGNIVGGGALSISSGAGADLSLQSASGTVVLGADTLQRSAAGTTTIDLLDASGGTTLSLVNSDISQVAGLSVEGGVSAASFTGDGSGLTDLNGTNITTGTIADGRLSTNVALLDGGQTFTALTNFSGALTVGNTADTTAGNIRWTGADLEVYDGTQWVSLTSGNSGTSVAGTFYDSTGGATINAGSFSTINLDTTLENSDNSLLVLSGNTLTVQQDGYYAISYEVSAQLASGTRSGFNAKLQIDTGAGFADVAGSQSYHYGRITTEPQGTSSAEVILHLTAGDILRIQGRGTTESFTTLAGGSRLTIAQTIPGAASGGGGSGTSFEQGGNGFGATALLGTTDAYGLTIVTNGSSALTIDSTGASTFQNGLTIAAGNLSVDSGVIDAIAGLTIQSGGAGDITLNAASDKLIIADSTVQLTAGGTTVLDLFDSGAGTTLSILNSDAGQVAGLTVEGDVSANTFTGNGSGLTSLNATNISSGTLSDVRLSTNVALLDTSQTFTGTPSFDSGIIINNTATTTAGAIRWTGLDFEGYDGTQWLSFTQNWAGSSVNVIKTVNEQITNNNTLQDDDELFFTIAANETVAFRFTVLGNSGTTPDFRFAVTAPSGATCVVNYIDAEGATSNGNYGCGVSTASIPGNAANDIYEIVGIVNNGANAGNVALQWAQFNTSGQTTTVLTGSYVQAILENSGSGGGGGGGTSFDQGGNAFGAKAILGTTDSFGLDLVINGSAALSFDNTGAATLNNGLTISSGNLSVNSGVVDSTSGLTIQSGGASDLVLDSASGTLVLVTDTLYRNGAGTTTIDLYNSGSDTTLSILNSSATDAAGLLVEGDVAANGFVGNGSGLTALDGTAISTGTINSARLGSDVAFNNTAQSFSGLQTFSDGAILGNSTSTTAGAIRWSGTDFEGYDGIQWVSLTSGGSSGAPLLDGVLAFGKYDGGAGSTINIDGATIAKNGTGNYTVTFDTAASTATYTILLSSEEPSATMDDVNINYENQTVNGFDVNVHEGDNGTTADILVDRIWDFMVIDSAAAAGGGGGGGTTFNQGGNDFGANGILGTTTNYDLNLITNNSTALSLTTSNQAIFSGAILANDGITIGNAASDGFTIVSDAVSLTNGLNFDNNTFAIDSTNDFVGISTSAPANRLSLNDASTADALAQALISSGAAGNKGLVIQGVASQTGNLFEIQDSSGAVSAGFNSSGGLVLGLSSVSSTATASRNINLPDADGTICLSSSSSCGFLPYATGSFVVDTSTNDTIAINKTGASGDLLALQKNGGAVFTVSNTGSLQIQSTDSAALDIRNVGGTSYFSVDTNTGQVQVGSSTADAIGVLFVLDTKNTAGDPAGTDGGFYYNSSLGKFRCFENGNWVDCIGTRQVRSFIDTTTDPVVDNNTTDYWDTAAENNNSYPNITPSSATKAVTASVVIEVLESGSTADRVVQSRIERGIGAPPTCGSGTVVGPILSNFTTNNNQNDTATVVFVDEPTTTSTVYYTVCSDSATSSASNMTVTRMRLTLEEANNTN